MYIFSYGLFCFYFFIFNVQFCFLKIVIELCCRKMLFLYVYMINIVFHSMNFEWEYFCSVFLQLHVLYRCYLCFCRLNSLTWFWLGFNSFIDTSKTSLETFLKDKWFWNICRVIWRLEIMRLKIPLKIESW